MKAGKTPLIPRPVDQQCGTGRDVPTDHEALVQDNAATVARVRSRRRATSNSRQVIGLISQADSKAQQGQGVRALWLGTLGSKAS